MLLDAYCPHCMSKISSYATKCPHCTHDTTSRMFVPIPSSVSSPDAASVRALWIGVGIGAVLIYCGWEICWSGFVMIAVAVAVFLCTCD